MDRVRTTTVVLVAAVLGLLGAAPVAADPLPGFDLDPVALEARMNDCLAHAVGEQEVLMGWRSLRDGKERNWRCSSLRHMYLDVGPGRPRHDPYADVRSFMICTDEVVSHGFPRPGDPGKTKLIYQYNGTRDEAIAVINDVTGDIVTIYTTTSNDWAGCARSLQW